MIIQEQIMFHVLSTVNILLNTSICRSKWNQIDKGLYSKTYKTLMKEIGNDTIKWKDTLCSQTGRVNIVKLSIVPQIIYRFNCILIKILISFLIKIEKQHQNSYRNTEVSEKPNLPWERTSWRHQLTDFKLYY